MSRTIDDRVVEMQFDNSNFEKNVSTSMSTLDKLKEKLNLGDAAKGFSDLDAAADKVDFSGMTSAISLVGEKFTALDVIAITALQRITNKAIDVGENLVRSLSVDQITAGWGKYEEKVTSVQTIMGATRQSWQENAEAIGFAGTQMEFVDAQLEKLNWFSDETSFSFTDMTNNIGKFTSAGVQLTDAVTAMEGISVWASLSGQSASEASRAYYNLAQAMSVGSVKLMDWKSIENANMATVEFKQTAIQTAEELGTLKKVGDGVWQTAKGSTVSVTNFNEALQDGWFSSEVLMQSLNDYGKAATKLSDISNEYGVTATAFLSGMDKLNAGTMTMEELSKDLEISVADLTPMIEELNSAEYELSLRAFKAAQEAKTFTEAIDATKDAVSTGWMKTFELIFGNYEQAKVVWTELANRLWDVFAAGGEARNEILELWAAGTGREDLIDGFWALWDAIDALIEPIKEAFGEIFPSTTESAATKLQLLTKRFKYFAQALMPSEETADKIRRTFKGLFAVLDIGKMAISAVIGGVKQLTSGLDGLSDGVLDGAASFGDWIVGIRDTIKEGKIFEGWVADFIKFLRTVKDKISDGIDVVVDKFNVVNEKFKDISGMSFGEMFSKIGKAFVDSFNNITQCLGEFLGMFKTTEDTVEKSKTKFEPFSILLQGLSSVFKGMLSVVKALSPVFIGLATVFGTVFDAIGKKIQEFTSNITSDDVVNVLEGGILGFLGYKLFKGGKEVSEITSVIDSIKEIFDGLSETISAFTNNIKSKTLMNIAISIGILTASLVALSFLDPDEIGTGLTAIGIALGELIATLTVIDGNKKIGNVGTTMIKIAASMLILSFALLELAKIPEADLKKGVIAIGALLTELGVFVKLLSGSKKLSSVTSGMTAFAIALAILVIPIKQLGDIPFEQLAQGLEGIGAILLELGIFIKLVGGSKGMISIGTGMLGVATSMLIFAKAVKSFASIGFEDLVIGLGAFSIVLLEISTAMAVIPATAPLVGAGMLLMATAMVILAGALKIIGTMDMDELKIALIAIGVVMAELAVAMLVMQNAIGGAAAMLIVAGAMAILAPALLLLGTIDGNELKMILLTIAASLGVLAVSALVLSPIIPIIIALAGALALIGVAALAFGAGVAILASGLALLGTLGTGGVLMLTLAIEAVIGLIPAIIVAIGEGLLSIIEMLANSVGDIATIVVGLFMKVLKLVAENGPEIVVTVLQFLIDLMNGIIEKIPDLIQLGIDIIIALIDGLAKGLVDNTERLRDAFLNLAKAMLESILIFFGIHSPSKKFQDIGSYIIEGFKNGIVDNAKKVVDAILNVGKRMVEGITGFVQDFVNIGSNIIEGLKNGISNAASAVVDAAKGVVEGAINGAKKLLGIKSPSRVFKEIGKFTDEGFALGLEQYSNKVTDATEDVGQDAIDTMRNTMSRISDLVLDDVDTDPTIKPVLDLSDVMNGADEINGLLSGNRSIGLAANAKYSMNSKIQNGEDLNINDKNIVNTLKELRSDMNNMIRAIGDISNMQMVMDTGTMVGVLTPAIDSELGNRAVLAGRGI